MSWEIGIMKYSTWKTYILNSIGKSKIFNKNAEGDHFAEFEQPKLLINDIVQFVTKVENIFKSKPKVNKPEEL